MIFLSVCLAAGCAAYFAVLLDACTDNEHAVTRQLPLFTQQLSLFTLSCYLQVNDLPTTMHSQGGNLCQETRMQFLDGLYGPSGLHVGCI